MGGELQVHVECRNGMCVLRIAGDLDTSMADALADDAGVAVEAVPGPVLVDLSGLRFIDAHGARALAAVIQALAARRPTVVRSCPPTIRRVLELLHLLPGFLAAEGGVSPASETFQLVTRVQLAQRDAGEVRDDARWVLARLTDTCIRVASTRERTGLAVEQGRHTLASSTAAREHLRQARHEAAP